MDAAIARRTGRFGGVVLLAAAVVPTVWAALPPDPQAWVCPGTDEPVSEAQIKTWCDARVRKASAVLPPPATIEDLEAKNRYDIALRDWLRSGAYTSWYHDQDWRLTGPYVGPIGSGESYGVHPLVRIYYSPEMMDWLCNDRQGEIEDGAIIIKEMHSIDADLVDVDGQSCMRVDSQDIKPTSWAVMTRHSGVAHDGWYWANPTASGDGNPPILDASAVVQDDFFGKPPIQRNPDWYPTGTVFQKLANGNAKLPDVVYPYNGFGAYCVNCHASAERQLTYSSMDNILGDGIRYKQFADHDGTDDALPAGSQHEDVPAAAPGYVSPFSQPLAKPNDDFMAFYGRLGTASFHEALGLRFPAETFDHAFSAADDPGGFVTSDQCIGCHDATASNDSTPNMLIPNPDEAGSMVNVSPYGEWRVSPMGLAGRDPIFFAQLQSETNHLPEQAACIENTCLHCHGVMGQREFAKDTADQGEECKDIFAIEPPAGVPFGQPYRRDMVATYQHGDGIDPKYGALSRDGISCTVCHRMTDDDFGKEASFTGNWVAGPADTLYGPFKDDTIVPKPMENTLGVTPKFGAQITDSAMCGTCHNILLPVFNNDGTLHNLTAPDGQVINHTYEQTTHLEWVNSDFAKEGTFESCQDCHMPKTFHGQAADAAPIDLSGMLIANIESDEFAPTTHRLPDEDITLTPREDFTRHSLHGLNVFLNEMFQQFPLILGLRQIDYMISPSVQPALITGRNSMLRMAAHETAEVAVDAVSIDASGQLRADIRVVNKTGHFLPSGVGFRRVFVEFGVYDDAGEALWISGKTNALGVIVDPATGEPIKGETGQAASTDFQPHYTVVTAQNQAQIYQEVIADSAGVINTSFLRRVTHLKDNRLRGKGYDPMVYRKNPSPYIQELSILIGNTAKDPDYFLPDLTGTDRLRYIAALGETASRAATVRVRLYSQSIPPYYLEDRFDDGRMGPGSDDIARLYYLTSHLNTGNDGGDNAPTHIKDWKLQIGETCMGVNGQACP